MLDVTLKIILLHYYMVLEVTNARKLLPQGQNFGLGCSKSGYNPRIIQK
jgi:hypothetical protein